MISENFLTSQELPDPALPEHRRDDFQREKFASLRKITGEPKNKAQVEGAANGLSDVNECYSDHLICWLLTYHHPTNTIRRTKNLKELPPHDVISPLIPSVGSIITENQFSPLEPLKVEMQKADVTFACIYSQSHFRRPNQTCLVQAAVVVPPLDRLLCLNLKIAKHNCRCQLQCTKCDMIYLSSSSPP